MFGKKMVKQILGWVGEKNSFFIEQWITMVPWIIYCSIQSILQIDKVVCVILNLIDQSYWLWRFQPKHTRSIWLLIVCLELLQFLGSFSCFLSQSTVEFSRSSGRLLQVPWLPSFLPSIDSIEQFLPLLSALQGLYKFLIRKLQSRSIKDSCVHFESQKIGDDSI